MHVSFFLHVDIEGDIDKEKLKFKLNSFLPEDIAIFQIVEVRDDAHARFDAVSRSYQYQVSLVKNVFENDLSLKIQENDLDIDKMNQAAQLMMDYSDFKCFSRSKTDVKTYQCSISESVWIKEGNKLIYCVTANRFLRNMVRAIVGTLLEVGKHKMSLDQFRKVIESRDRTMAGASAKAKGLYLTHIQYPKRIFIK